METLADGKFRFRMDKRAKWLTALALSVEIHCIMELIKIPVRDIRHIRFVERGHMKYCFPIWGIYGIGGYYGYYFSLRERKVFRLCASQWRNFVLIEDIYEEQYIVSCDDPAAFIAAVERYR